MPPRKTSTASRRTLLAALLSIGLAGSAAAIERVVLPPPAAGAAFTILEGTRRTPVSLVELEALGLYRIVTVSPWEEGRIVFEGVLLRDVLKMAGLDAEPAIRLKAADDYTTVIPREDWTAAPALIATRQDGKALTRREQGPTRLVYPISEHPELYTENHKRRWVWLIETIETIEQP